MNSNLKIPFKNHFLLSSLQHDAQTVRNKANLQLKYDQKIQESDDSTEQSLSYSVGTQLLARNNTQLSYSIQNLENNETPSAARDAANTQYLVYYHNQSQMNSLLTFEPDKNGESYLEDKQDKLDLCIHNQNQRVNEQMFNNIQSSVEQKFDYSQELHSLKSKIVEIQSIAQLEIIRLKHQLAQEKQLRKSKERSKMGETRDVGTNTEKDLRDEQIQVLKNSILGHLDLNRKLLLKQVKKNGSSQMENVMNMIKL